MDAAREIAEQAARSSAAAIAELLARMRDHRLYAISREAAALRYRLNAVRPESEAIFTPAALFRLVFLTPARNNTPERAAVEQERAALEAALLAKEQEEQEAQKDYEELDRLFKAESLRYTEARQMLQLLTPFSPEAGVAGEPTSEPSESPESHVDTPIVRVSEMDRLRGIAARDSGRMRERGWRVKKKLMLKQAECPYCGSDLGDRPHADHIYPVSKGGLSIEANMVLACESCNNKKGTLTLQAFIKAFALDRDAVEERLRQLRKDF
jgi:5-methylcytosine-specific restriction endonuclease McrA